MFFDKTFLKTTLTHIKLEGIYKIKNNNNNNISTKYRKIVSPTHVTSPKDELAIQDYGFLPLIGIEKAACRVFFSNDRDRGAVWIWRLHFTFVFFLSFFFFLFFFSLLHTRLGGQRLLFMLLFMNSSHSLLTFQSLYQSCGSHKQCMRPTNFTFQQLFY